MKILKFLKIK